MRFLLLNQAFHPDVVATAQYLTDVARGLVARGHHVEVISGRRAYDDLHRLFSARERWNGIEIRRARSTRFGKSARWRRALDFASFMAGCSCELLFVRRPDVVLALSSPPLISFLAACYAALRRCPCVYWVMDLNPDQAIAAGWLRQNSLPGRFLRALSKFSLCRARHIVVLDRFMKQRVRAQGVPDRNIIIFPPWSQDDSVQFHAAGRDEFRAAHALADKFVVMYSGNHSPCHPLVTLLEAARQLASTDPRVVFCFVGGGSEFAGVRRFAAANGLKNIVTLPYQPLAKLSASLSVADLHVVVMGDAFVGMIHPCKIYNILSVQAPLLYIGAPESHIADILQAAGDTVDTHAVRHGDVGGVIQSIRTAGATRRSRAPIPAAQQYTKQTLLPRLLDLLEDAVS